MNFITLGLLLFFSNSAIARRFQFGNVITKNQFEGNILLDNDTQYNLPDGTVGYARATQILLDLSPTFRFTTYVAPTKEQNPYYSDLVKSDGCIKTWVMSLKDLASKPREQWADFELVIFTDSEFSTDKFNLIKDFLTSTNGAFGLTAPVKAQSDYDFLVNFGKPFFQNVKLPLIDFSKIKQPLYGFKFVFAPFRNATSLYNDNLPRLALVNLANLVAYEADDALTNFCTLNRNNLTLLSHTLLSDSLPMQNGIKPPRFEMHIGKRKPWFGFSGKTGTHIVPPSRFDMTSGIYKLSQLPDSTLFAPCIRVNLDDLPTDGPEAYQITTSLLRHYEETRINSTIPENSIVLIDTGYGNRWWSDQKSYTQNFPYLHEDAARFLVENRSALAIGFDSLLLDNDEKLYKTHSYLSQKNIPALLNVKINKDLLPDGPTGARCLLNFINIAEGVSSSPVAIFALPNYETAISTKTVSPPVALGVVEEKTGQATTETPISGSRGDGESVIVPLSGNETVPVPANGTNLTVPEIAPGESIKPYPTLPNLMTSTPGAPSEEKSPSLTVEAVLEANDTKITGDVKTTSKPTSYSSRATKALPSSIFIFVAIAAVNRL